MIYHRGVASKQTVEIEGIRLALTNLDKELYPGFTKAQVIDYYLRIAPVLLPHLKDRPVTLKRYPNGVEGGHFYEKNAPKFTPEWVATFGVPRRAGGPEIRYILINNLATLAWTANLANLEIHPFLHRVPKIDEPGSIVFDLDPGEGADIVDCAEMAFAIRSLLSSWKLESVVKVSGSRGLQMYVPLNTRVTYEATQSFAKAVAEWMSREHPGAAVARMAKSAARQNFHRLEPKLGFQDDGFGLLASRETSRPVRVASPRLGRLEVRGETGQGC